MNVPSTALIVGAHPDDCEFGAGGTVWNWTQQGCSVDFVIATDGSQGSGNEARAANDLVATRKKEQLAAAELLGVRDCVFLGLPDGGLKNDDSLLGALVRVIRERRPEVLVTHTTESLDHRPFDRADGSWVNHRDHRNLAQACLDAVYPYARNPNSFADLKHQTHKVQEIWIWGSRFPNHSMDIGDGLGKKAAALACHESQFSDATDWSQLMSLWGSKEEFEIVRLPQ